MQERYDVSVRRSCRLALLRPSVWYQKSKARDQSALRLRIREIAMDRPRFGYLRVLVMLKREGWAVGKKRVYRLYRLEGLQLRMKVKRRKRISLQRGRPVLATAPNQHWSMDFVHDQMLDGWAFRVLTVIDQWSRESVSLEANFRLTGRCVGKALDEAARERGWPKAITVDNGTEFTSKALDEWAWRRGVKLDYTRPGKPIQKPTASPSVVIAAPAARNSGHKLCGLKKPSSPAPSAISASLRSSGRAASRRPVKIR